MVYLLLIAVSFVTFLYFWLKHKYSYWEKKGIKGPKPVPVLGSFGRVFGLQESIPDFSKRIYKDFPNEPIVGIYQGFRPGILMRDPELIKHVIIKDFNVFLNRGITAAEDNFGQNLFNAEGDRWKVLRQKFTPIFTSQKLRKMMPLISKAIGDYVKYTEKLVDQNKDQEIRDLVSKYTLEVIGSCVFGVELQSFTTETSAFLEFGNKFWNVSKIVRLKQLLIFFVPEVAKFLHKKFKMALRDESVKTFFVDLVKNIVAEREGKEKVRNDFMDILIELKEQGKAVRRDDDKAVEIEIDVDLIAAQAAVFYAAGYETSAGAMSFLLYELALHPEYQELAAQEVREVIKKHNGVLNYDTITDMTYLTACLDETLRKYPVTGQIVRVSEERYTFPGTNITIDKGTPVMVPMAALHEDPKYFKNPTAFRPDRFLGDNKNNIQPCTYLPFGEGPRHCIGKIFFFLLLLMEYKAGFECIAIINQTFLMLYPADKRAAE